MLQSTYTRDVSDLVIPQIENPQIRQGGHVFHVLNLVAGEIATCKRDKKVYSSSSLTSDDMSGISLILLKERSSTLGLREMTAETVDSQTEKSA